MNELVKRLRDEVCAVSKDYLYEANSDNYEIEFDGDIEAKCKEASGFNASQVYFKDKKECKKVAKIISHIFKTKKKLAPEQVNAEKKLAPEQVKVKVVFTKKDATEEDFTKLYYKLYINDKLITKDGSVFSKVGYEVYSKKHILTAILIQIMSDYATALEFDCLKDYDLINEFRKEYGYNNIDELLDISKRLKKICKHLKPLKLDEKEVEKYIYLLDEFDNDYNDEMFKEPIIKNLTDKYFNISYNEKLDLFLKDEEN